MILPIEWNQETEQWDVKDQKGTVLHSEPKYADAASWAADYVKRQAFKNVLAVASDRG